MSRFEITQDIIKEGIEEKMGNLKSLLEQDFLLAKKPTTISFKDHGKKDARNITEKKLKVEDEKFKYMEDIQKAIYIVSAPDFPFSFGEIDADNGDFKKLKETTALPRISPESHWKHQEKKNSRCLYVGSSHDIVSRVIQHFWKCAKDVYSLHLIEWDWWNKKNEVQIDIWDFSKVSDIHLQIIEDIVWDTYKPLFGRPGAK